MVKIVIIINTKSNTNSLSIQSIFSIPTHNNIMITELILATETIETVESFLDDCYEQFTDNNDPSNINCVYEILESLHDYLDDRKNNPEFRRPLE